MNTQTVRLYISVLIEFTSVISLFVSCHVHGNYSIIYRVRDCDLRGCCIAAVVCCTDVSPGVALPPLVLQGAYREIGDSDRQVTSTITSDELAGRLAAILAARSPSSPTREIGLRLFIL